MAQTKESIWVRLVGANKVVTDAKKISKSFEGLNKRIKTVGQGAAGMRTAILGAGGAFAAIALGIRKTIVEYEKYTIAQSRVRTTLAAQTVNYRQNAALVQELAEGVGTDLGYSLQETTTAMNTMLQTGLGVHKSMRVYGTAMQLARVADMDAADSVQFLTDTMNMFRREAGEANEEVQHFARRMGTQLSVAANLSSTNIGDLQQAFRYAGGELSSLGFSSRETMSALAALSTVGLRASTAGTRLRGAIAALHTPSEKTKSLFASVGVTAEELNQIFYDSEGRIRPLTDGMDNLSELFKKLPSQQMRNAALIRLFGRRSLAAGVTLARLTSAGEKMNEVFAEMGREEVTEGTILDRQAAERMRSFGMQMEQLRQGVNDLSIAFGETLFGAMDDTNEGFGTYIRNVASAVRLSDMSRGSTEEHRRQWEALSPEVRATGTELKSFFEDLSWVIKGLAGIVRVFGQIYTAYPRIVTGLILLKAATGIGLVNALFAARWGFRKLSAATLTWVGNANTATAASRRLTAARVAGFAAVLAVGNELAGAVTNWGVKLGGFEKEFEELQQTQAGVAANMAKEIPLVGNLAAAYLNLGSAISLAWQANKRLEDQRIAFRDREIRATAEERVSARIATTRGRHGDTQESIRSRATGFEYMQSIQKMAALAYARDVRNAESLTEMLSEAGMSGERLSDAVERILQVQQSQGETLEEDVKHMFPQAGRITGVRLNRALENTTRQVAGFGSLLGEVIRQNELEGEEFGVGTSTMQTVQDASVQRGGVIRVSSGDIVVSRNELASAIATRRGGMAGAAVGAAPTQVVGPAPIQGAQTSQEIVVPVSVQIDGREVARAVGRQHVRHLERSGSDFEPQQRRTLVETGFSERLG